MRSLFILMIVIGMVPVILRFPQIGVIMWSWVSYMNPHRMTWGIAQEFPIADTVAIATLAAIAFAAKERKFPINHPLIVLSLIYAFWISLTTVFAIDPSTSYPKWLQTEKILLFTFITATIMITKNRIYALIWVIVLSIGYYGIKGGIFTILTGGGAHVVGPPSSFIGANNSLSAALNMIIPLMWFLRLNTENKYIKKLLGWSALLCMIAILGTQARGGVIALGAMLVFYLIKSRKIMLAVSLMTVTALAATVFMSDSWKERMGSIQSYETDESFQGRVEMWNYALDVAAERPINGGGFDIFYHDPTLNRLLPEGVEGRASHNSFFEVLGEHGYVGLLLFVSILATTFFTAGAIIRKSRGHEELKWSGDLGAMVQVSLVGYSVNSIVINFATYDLFWHLVVIVAVVSLLVDKQLVALSRAKQAPAPDPRFDPAGTAAALGNRQLTKF